MTHHPLHGWLNIDKPVGMSSAQVVGACKRILRPVMPKGHKIGHGGTLDPLATGVLPIALGEATKLSGYMLDAIKGYDFTIEFGTATSTEDKEGEVIAVSDVRPTLQQIEAVLPQFTGLISQIPPTYSALKIDGERAYARARAGEVVAMLARQVTVYALLLHPAPLQSTGAQCLPLLSGRGTASLAVEGQAGGENDAEHCVVTLSTLVSKGTYIRSLARDIAVALGTVGHVSMLRRTKAGPFTLETAISLDSLAQLVLGNIQEQALLPLTAGLDDIPALAVTPDQAIQLKHGKRLVLGPDTAGHLANPGTYLAMNLSVPVALVTFDGVSVSVLRGLNL